MVFPVVGWKDHNKYLRNVSRVIGGGGKGRLLRAVQSVNFIKKKKKDKRERKLSGSQSDPYIYLYTPL